MSQSCHSHLPAKAINRVAQPLWVWVAYVYNRSEGLPRTGYLVPGRDGLGVWPDGSIVAASSSSSSVSVPQMVPKRPQISEKCYFLRLDMSQNSRNRVPKIIQGSTTQPLEPPARLRPPAARISRALEIMEASVSNISRI